MESNTKKKIAELYILTNQIKLELRQAKRQQPFYCQTKSTSQKKQFLQKNKSTNILTPLEHPHSPSEKVSKKHFNQSVFAHQNFNKPIEKKHFRKHYKDSVDTSMPRQHKRSNYVHQRSTTEASPLSNRSNLLLGVGEKSGPAHRRHSCIRLYPQQYLMRQGLV